VASNFTSGFVGYSETILALAACSTFSNFPQNGVMGDHDRFRDSDRMGRVVEWRRLSNASELHCLASRREIEHPFSASVLL
jgi:hypothetical protein